MTLPARGTPDWGAPSYEASAAQVDLGQVLSGLYHFDRVDQRGRVAIVETWGEGMLGWKLAATGAGTFPQAILGNSGRNAFIPPAYAYFNCGGSAAGDSSEASRDIHLGMSQRLGLEIAVTPTTNSLLGLQVFQVDYIRAAGQSRKMKLIYDPGNAVWFIDTLNFGLVVVAAESSSAEIFWRQAKVVGDWVTGRYVSVILGDKAYNVSQYTLLASSIGQASRCQVKLRVSGGGGAFTDVMPVGYVVLTRDEP